MTGSAGTAVDVLVTCSSKRGGGSGRRGTKSLTGSVTLGVDVEFDSFSGGVSKSVARAILWTHLGEMRVPSAVF